MIETSGGVGQEWPTLSSWEGGEEEEHTEGE